MENSLSYYYHVCKKEAIARTSIKKMYDAYGTKCDSVCGFQLSSTWVRKTVNFFVGY